MKYHILLAIGLAMVLPLQAAEDSPKAKHCPKACPVKAFNRKDKNDDGQLTKEEFIGKAKNATKAGERFAKRDKNNDGQLTLAEFQGKKAPAAKGKKAGGKKAQAAKGNKAGGKRADKRAEKKANRADQNK